MRTNTDDDFEMNAFKSFKTLKQINPFDGAICRFERLELLERFEQRRRNV